MTSVDLAQAICDYEEERRMMLHCCDLYSRENGMSYYAQRSAQCAKIVEALEIVQRERLTIP